jgi:molybdopterin converting factor small subunit
MAAGTVTVLFFAGAREAVGVPSIDVELPLDAGEGRAPAVGDLLRLLGPEVEARLAPLMKTCALWVNRAPARPETKLAPGDEVAVLPPVSGG